VRKNLDNIIYIRVALRRGKDSSCKPLSGEKNDWKRNGEENALRKLRVQLRAQLRALASISFEHKSEVGSNKLILVSIDRTRP